MPVLVPRLVMMIPIKPQTQIGGQRDGHHVNPDTILWTVMLIVSPVLQDPTAPSRTKHPFLAQMVGNQMSLLHIVSDVLLEWNARIRLPGIMSTALTVHTMTGCTPTVHHVHYHQATVKLPAVLSMHPIALCVLPAISAQSQTVETDNLHKAHQTLSNLVLMEHGQKAMQQDVFWQNLVTSLHLTQRLMLIPSTPVK